MNRRATLTLAALLSSGCSAVDSTSALTVPFDPRSDQVTIDTRVNQTLLQFLVDTAVDPSAIDQPSAVAAGLQRLGDDEAIDGVGNDAAVAYPSVIPKLDIAGRAFGPVDVVVNDMSKLRARYGAQLDGILGYSLLKSHAALFDYPGNRITFFDGKTRREPTGCRKIHRFAIQYRAEDDKTILVPGLAIGGVEVPAFLDTGSSNGLRMDVESPALAQIRHMLPEGEASTSVGARGEAAVRHGSLTQPVALGPFRLDRTDVSMVSEKGAYREVNIGNRFLRAIGAKLLVDIPAQQVALFGDCRGGS